MTGNSVKRYLALWFPFLSTDRLRIEQENGTLHNAPLAMVTKVRGALRLGAVNGAARDRGMAVGMALADARAVLPDLIVAEMDEDADAHWLMRLARRCGAWSPHVMVTPPDGLVMESTGVDHLFGGEAGLAAQVEDAMADIGMTTRVAMAATSEAAQALVRYGVHKGQGPVADEGGAIRALPIAALGLEHEAALALSRAGLKTVGDVAGRSMAAIAARFGAQAVTALRRLLGEEQAPIAPITRPRPLRFERRFPEPIGLQSSIAACFLDLMHQAAGEMAQRDLGGRRFALTLFRSDGARHRLRIETGLPTRDPALVLRLFDERIAALADPLDPGFGYDRITLLVPLAEPLMASQSALGGEEKQEAALAELIDRLSTRLGPDALRRLVPQDSHMPEQAQCAVAALHHAPGHHAPIAWPAPAQGEPPLRPLFLFDPPQRVDVIAEVPDGPPHRFRWRGTLYEIGRFEGPERIAAQWWRRKEGEIPGMGGLTRDYYRVEDRHGRRYWIFRHGLYEEKPDPHWYMHGLFA
ncbi:DNA polymerase Y family protein [Novosphingobium humi]